MGQNFQWLPEHAREDVCFVFGLICSCLEQDVQKILKWLAPVPGCPYKRSYVGFS